MNGEIIWKRMIYHKTDLGDYYLVSNTGEIKGVKTGKIRKKNINHEGYYFVGISLGSRGIQPCIKVHRAVAETFIENINDYTVINHKDGNKLNNNVSNLEWCTYSENTIHAIEHNLIDFTKCKKPIIRLSDSMMFESVTDAAKYINKNNYETVRKNISRELNKNGLAYGEQWIYAET